MSKTTTNKLPKHTAKTGHRFTLLAGALLVLIGLPTLGVAGQHITLDRTLSTPIVFGSADDYGDTKQDDEDWSGTYAPSAGKAQSNHLSKHSASLGLVALNDQKDGGDKSGYGEIVLDED